MAFDYSKLRGKIREVFKRQDLFAKAMRLSHTSVSLKLNNQREWTQKEISRAAELLGIRDDEITAYFFTLKV
jgi:hypothetical protein